MEATKTLATTTQIVKTPGIIGGKPHVDGRRIGVHDIALRYVHFEQAVDDIVEAFDLTPAQVHAALAYYYDHVEEIEAILADERAFEESLRDPEEKAQSEAEYQKWLAGWRADPDAIMTVTDVAEEFGLSTPTVRIAIKNGWLAAHKSGKTWLIRRRDAQARWGKGKRRKGER